MRPRPRYLPTCCAGKFRRRAMPTRPLQAQFPRHPHPRPRHPATPPPRLHRLLRSRRAPPRQQHAKWYVEGGVLPVVLNYGSALLLAHSSCRWACRCRSADVSFALLRTQRGVLAVSRAWCVSPARRCGPLVERQDQQRALVQHLREASQARNAVAAIPAVAVAARRKLVPQDLRAIVAQLYSHAHGHVLGRVSILRFHRCRFRHCHG